MCSVSASSRGEDESVFTETAGNPSEELWAALGTPLKCVGQRRPLTLIGLSV